MEQPKVVSAEEWQQARDELLKAEKEATRALDAIAARRRRLPMVKFRTDYEFATPFGPKNLIGLFEGRPQPAAYQFMDNGPDAYCPGCTHFTRNVADLGALAGPDRGLPGPDGLDDAVRLLPRHVVRGRLRGRRRLRAQHVPAGREDVYRTYSTTARGVDRLLFANNIQDLSVYGRQEDWEDSPPGWPQHPTYG
jgi:predicted dithiol-disulfide oxidoreductase (DUF899 family)